MVAVKNRRARVRALLVENAVSSQPELLALLRDNSARARAFLDGRGFVTPHDVKSVGMEVMRHRVITTYEAEAEGVTSEEVVQQVFDSVRVP